VRHVFDVLHRAAGEPFDAGLIDGPRGKGRLHAISPDSVRIEFSAEVEPAPLAPITLIVGLPRPQTARDVLRETATLGVTAVHFVLTDKGDPNYAQSTLWSRGEWQRHVRTGAEQAFSTRLPQVTCGQTLTERIASLTDTGARCALDNYESPLPLSTTPLTPLPITFALGSERGWSAAERVLLRSAGFAFAHLGDRVLRTETACIAAITLAKARLGLM
jgi:RsmE family RNA methyltransferase